MLRLIDIFRGMGFYVGGVVMTRYSGQGAADAFLKRLTALGIRCYRHYPIAGYPSCLLYTSPPGPWSWERRRAP